MKLVKTSWTHSIHTVYPRISDPFYIVSNYMKWVTTSWTYSRILNSIIIEDWLSSTLESLKTIWDAGSTHFFPQINSKLIFISHVYFKTTEAGKSTTYVVKATLLFFTLSNLIYYLFFWV